METANTNPYRAPESDVGALELGVGITNFERFSAWGVFALSIITLGIYPIYWLYSRSNTLNSFHSNKISPVLLMAFVALVFASFVIGIINPQEGVMLVLGGVVNLAYTIAYLMVLFSVRNRLNELVNDGISPIITFFGSAIYLQYSINKCIDQQKTLV